MYSKSNNDTSPAPHTLNEVSLDSSSEKWIDTYPPPKHSNTESQWARKWTTGASLAANRSDVEKLKRWLDTHNLTARAFDFIEFEDFIRLIEKEQVTWAVVSSAGSILGHPEFDRLFRTLIETDTHLYTADDNYCLSNTLFFFAVRNWEFVTPYASADTQGPSLTSQADALRRIENQLRGLAAKQEDPGASIRSREVTDLERCIQAVESASRSRTSPRLTPKERELFDAADPDVPLRGKALAAKAGHDDDGHTRMLLAGLVNRGLLEKRLGGYVKKPECHDMSGKTKSEAPQ